MFYLKFISKENFSSSRNEKIALGEIRLGNFWENFESSLSFWTKEDYQKQWDDAIKRILECNRTAFVTDLGNPETANFVTWWTAWKVEERIYFQNQLLLLDQLSEQFDLNNPYKFIGERITKTEEGEKISEWNISLNEITNFLKTNE